MPLLWNNGYYFNDSKYTHIYFRLIHKAQSKDRRKHQGVYFEDHHIVPRSIERSSSITVLLTAKEHFICHLLLTKMCLNLRHYYKMLNAFHMMCNRADIGRCTSAIYSKLRSEIAEAKRVLNTGKGNPFYGRNHSPENIEAQRLRMKQQNWTGEKNPNYGKKWTDEQKAVASELTKNMSDETRKKMGDAQRGRRHSPEHREKVRLASLGRVLSPESKEKCRQTKIGELNPNFGKKYDDEYKSEMRDKLLSITDFMIKNRAIRIYNTVFNTCGRFDESAFNIVKDQGLLVKRPTTYSKIVSILKLESKNPNERILFQMWEGKRKYS